jgi:DNA repair protein RadC
MAPNLNIKAWAEEDRPREKLLEKGKGALSNAELIAILIGSGHLEESAVDVGKQILHLAENDLNKLATLTVDELTRVKGVGQAKAIAIVSALELGRRRKHNSSGTPKISSSSDAYNYLAKDLLDLKHEEFWVIFLKRDNRVISKKAISSGGIAGTVADPKIIYKLALDKLASSIIVAHNHPSGNLKPSEADLNLTKKLKDAGKLLEISLLDHLIFGQQEYVSFADEGIL